MSQASNNWIPKLEELIGLLLDNDLNEEQAAELQHLLQSQQGARRHFAEHMQLVSMLEEELPLKSIDSRKMVTASTKPLKTRHTRPLLYLVPLIAASIALVIILNWPIGSGRDRDDLATETTDPTESVLDDGVAVVTRMVDARWAADAAVDVGSSIAPGVLTLEAGLVQFEFYRGAVVVVEGPAELELLDADRLVCRRGRLRAHVPPQSQGFAVFSPQFELVDLGTEFGVSVADDGSASVHVFEGKVELYDIDSNRSAHSRREVLAATGLAVSAEGEFQSVAPESNSFVSSAKLRRLATEEEQRHMTQWQAFSERMQNDPRVVVYYSFEQDSEQPRVLRGQSDGGRPLDGAIVGCTWSTGRWPGKGALEFKRPGDRVRLHIPGEFESLTYAAWVRIDGLDRPFSSLILTNGFDGGEPHWQLRGDGRLLLGVRKPSGRGVSYDSNSILDISRLGQWIHLATVYDGVKGEVLHFAGGAVVGRQKVQTAKVALTLGDTEIGNWGTPPTYSPQKIRNLNGRIDEFVLFREALSEHEIQELYASGKP